MGHPGGARLPTQRPDPKLSATGRGERSRRRISPRSPARLPHIRFGAVSELSLKSANGVSIPCQA